MLGGDAALRRLLDEAHARGMKVVLDGVFNHASRGFFQFHDILENGSNSAYLDWFTVNGFPLYAYDAERPPATARGGDCRPCPSSTSEDAGRPRITFSWEVGKRWIDFGIDGWRLDVANEIDDDDFWREFRRGSAAANPGGVHRRRGLDRFPPLAEGRYVGRGDELHVHAACIAFFIGQASNEGELKRTSSVSRRAIGREGVRRRGSTNCSACITRASRR